MNLGDGLLFELENGKPRLILRQNGVERNPAKSCRLQVEGPQAELPVRRFGSRNREARSRVGAACSSGGPDVTSSNEQEAGGKAKASAKARSDRLKLSTTGGSLGSRGRGAPAQKSTAGVRAGLDGGVVCLTNQQLEQILNAVQTSSRAPEPVQEHTDGRADAPVREGGEEQREERVKAHTPQGSPERERRAAGGLLSWMEESESESHAAMDAKRAQWRRDLDEQVAQKQLSSALRRPQAEDDTLSLVSVHSSLSLQPAAIRSSLRFGEVSAVAEAVSARIKEEERRAWLEELDKQRDEAAHRRRQEKLLLSQTEDHLRWCLHFDTLHRKPPLPPALPPAPMEGGGSKSGGLDVSSSLSLWDAMSSCGADSLGRASVDTSAGCPTRTSYLRTMTALLDPAQLEERERRRLKQLEQQRAIEAQLEERRRRREREEEKRRQEEQEEERKLEMQRETMQRQYETEEWRRRREREEEEEERRRLEEERKVELQREVLQRQYEMDTQREGQQQVELLSSRLEPSRSEPSRCAQTLQNDDSSHSGENTGHTHTEKLPHAPGTNGKHKAERSGKENVPERRGREGGGEDVYEAFARTDRSRRDKRRPEWNTQRPSRRFVPASERYPAGLQRHRQESRLKRQAELLALQERNCASRSDLPPPHPQQEAGLSSDPSQTTSSHTVKVDQRSSTPSCWSTNRGRSSPVPTIKHNILRPPSSSSPPAAHSLAQDFVPYVRTDQVLNPYEPTAAPPHLSHTEAPLKSPCPSALLRPEPTPRTQRQQEILRCLAQLRQGLLAKQRELETDLNPLLRPDDTRRAFSASHGLVTSDPTAQPSARS